MRLCHSHPPNFRSLRRSGLGATAECFAFRVKDDKGKISFIQSLIFETILTFSSLRSFLIKNMAGLRPSLPSCVVLINSFLNF